MYWEPWWHRIRYASLAYEEALRVSPGEDRTLIEILARDWRDRAGSFLTRIESELHTQGGSPLRSDACDADELEAWWQGKAEAEPSDANTTASTLQGARPIVQLLERLDSLLEHVLVCVQLVPLAGVSPDVHSLFRWGVEVEDTHLERVRWVRAMLAG